MLRLTWPAAILGGVFLLVIARFPSLLFRRAFFPVIVVVAIVFLAGYRRRARRRLASKGRP